MKIRFALRTTALLVASLSSVLSGPLQAATLRVPQDYPTIQAGIDASSLGDTVLVAPGNYRDFEQRGYNVAYAFLKDGVALVSESGSAATIIDMGNDAGPDHIGFWGRELHSETTLVEGFTIRGASLPSHGFEVATTGRVTIRDCSVRDIMEPRYSRGGAIRAINTSHLVVEDCEFLRCTGDYAGTIYHSDGHIDLLRTTIRECSGRVLRFESAPGLPYESAVLEDCRLIENTGKVIASIQIPGEIVVRRCWIEGNLTEGGVAPTVNINPLLYSNTAIIEDCVFLRNQSLELYGAALRLTGSGLCQITGNTFFENATIPGSPTCAIECNIPVQLERNIIANCVNGAAVRVESHLLNSVSCNVYWENEAGNGISLGPTDREADPLFCDPESGTLTLQTGSPCLPENSGGCGRIGALGHGCGTVSIARESWGSIKALYFDPSR